MEQSSLQIIATQDVVAIIETAPAVLDRNKQAIEKINTKAQYLINKKAELGMTPELDAEMNDFLVKVRDAKAAALLRRTNLTQLFDSVKTAFTTIEKAMDPKTAGSLVAAIQDARNEWVRTLAELERKRLQDEMLKKNQAAEITGLTYKTEARIRDHFNILLNDHLNRMQEQFNAATLHNYKNTCDLIENASDQYPSGHYYGYNPDLSVEVIYNKKEIALEILENVKQSGMFDVLYNEWMVAVKQKKEFLLEMLPGKLDSLKKAEADRIAAEQAEQDRKKQEIIRAQAEQAARDAKTAEEAEAARIRVENAEKERLIIEAQQRELDLERERTRKEEELRQQEIELQQKREAAERDDKAQKEIEMRKSAQEAQDLFSHTAATAEPTSEQAGQVRSGFEITVKAQAGWMLILNLWFQHEGGKLPMDKFETKKLGSIKAWCEKHCYKTGEQIKSPLLEYNPTYTAVSTNK